MSSNINPRKGVRGTIRELGRDLKELLRSPSPQPPLPSQQPQAFPPVQTNNSQPSGSPFTSSPAQNARASSQFAWAGLETALQKLKLTCNLCPPLGSVIDGLTASLNVLKVSTDNRQQYKDPASSLATIIQDLETHLRESPVLQRSSYLYNTTSGLRKEIEYINNKKNQWGPRWYTEAVNDTDDLVECYRRIELLFQRLQSNAVLSVWSITNEHLANSRLDYMQPVKQARHDSAMASVVRRRECTPNTRRTVLGELQGWARNVGGPKIYWMNGMAGTGKTTIAQTFSVELERSHQLAASFFCSRELPACRDPARIVPTIAYQLARFSRPFQSVLCRVLGDDPDVSTCGIAVQFERLLRQPLLEVEDTLPSDLVVVVDALDECTNQDVAKIFFDALFSHALLLPIKFFVTCRPEPVLYNTLQYQDATSRLLFHLHDIDSSTVQADIGTYLSVELEDVSKYHIDELVKASGKLFIFAATVVRYVKPSSATTIYYDRLDTILYATWISGSKAYSSIDQLYDTILSSALGNDEVERLEMLTMTEVLRTVICAKEPMKIDTLAGILEISIDTAIRTINPLRSVLHVSEESGHVSTLHASFPDYIFNNERSGRFFCSRDNHNEVFAVCCFDTMSRLLRFNICNLESSYIMDADISDLPQRITDNIPDHLLYACKYWADHACESGLGFGFMPLLRDFLELRVLFWLEVLNLTKYMHQGLIELPKLCKWLRHHCAPIHICQLAEDAYRFAAMVTGNDVSNSTPHIYISVLALWDRRQSMWTQYGEKVNCLMRRGNAARAARTSSALAVWNTDTGLRSLVVSPDGTRMLLLIGRTKAVVLDAYTGHAIFELPLPPGSTMCAAFSPDGRRIVSGSANCAICIWDAQTGYLQRGPLKQCILSAEFSVSPGMWLHFLHRRHSIAFSEDGARIVYVTKPGAVYTWDASTGRPLASSIVGRNRNITSVALSSVGGLIATGSSDGHVHICDAYTGNMVADPLYTPQASGKVNVISFSLDDELIASGLGDGTICIWVVQTKHLRVVVNDGYVRGVSCVIFSPNSRLFASASFDLAICVWDSQTGNKCAGPLFGHTRPAVSLAFTPDGSHLVSGSSDGTVRVWDVRAGHISQTEKLDEHASDPLSVVFSPDRNCSSASQDNIIRLWNIQSGNMAVNPLQGHNDSINSVTFSDRDDRIASGSVDQLFYTREPNTREIIFCRQTENTNSVTLEFTIRPKHTPTSYDSNVCIWNADNGRLVPVLLAGYSYPVIEGWSNEDTGWIIGSNSERILWVMPDLRFWKSKTKMTFDKEPLDFDIEEAAIGTRWKEVWIG